MRNKWYLILLLACYSLLGHADLQQEAMQPDFIKASLLVVDPGEEVYSSYGHTAIRLECPSKKLDYCFSFEMDLDAGTKLDFFLHRANAGFISAETPVFLEQYKQTKRGIKSYRLNLTPLEKQQLWKNLDEEVSGGPVWKYDYPGTNCSSMCIYIIQKSLQGDTIVYHQLNPILQESYRDLLHYISHDDPWAQLFWDIMITGQGDTVGTIEEKMAPQLLVESWKNATFADSLGKQRPVFVGTSVILPSQTVVSHSWFTPTVCGICIALIIIICIILIIYKRTKIRIS